MMDKQVKSAHPENLFSFKAFEMLMTGDAESIGGPRHAWQHCLATLNQRPNTCLQYKPWSTRTHKCFQVKVRHASGPRRSHGKVKPSRSRIEISNWRYSLAPALRKSLATSVCSFLTALPRGVSPSLLLAFGSAPASSKSFTASAEPPLAAK